MSYLSSLKRMVRGGLDRIVRNEVERALGEVMPSVLEFSQSSPEERQSARDHTKEPLANLDFYDELRRRLVQTGVPVEERAIDIADFDRWLNAFPEMAQFYVGLGDVYIEKCLEHYLAWSYVSPGPGTTYVDVGSSGSPWRAILEARGVDAYSLDLSYEPGVHGKCIGGDAGNLPLPVGFADGQSVQCAFECFMGEADVGFVKSTARVLRDGGRCAVLPLYLEDEYFVCTSPLCKQSEVKIDDGAKKVWRDDQYVVPFSRHYSPEAFAQRVYSAIPEGLSAAVIAFTNIDEVMGHYPGQRVYCFFMLTLEKAKNSHR
jgi:hypothetical protein